MKVEVRVPPGGTPGIDPTFDFSIQPERRNAPKYIFQFRLALADDQSLGFAVRHLVGGVLFGGPSLLTSLDRPPNYSSRRYELEGGRDHAIEVRAWRTEDVSDLARTATLPLVRTLIFRLTGDTP